VNELRRIEAAMDALVNGTRKASSKKMTQNVWEGIISPEDVEDMSDEYIEEMGWTPKELAMIAKLEDSTSFSGWDFSNIYFDNVVFFASYDFSNANMRGTDGVLDLAVASNFDGADFSGSGIKFLEAEKSTFKGAKFVKAELDSNFNDCNFTGADFTGANFSTTILVGANLTKANFSGADLSNAEGLESANLTGIKYNAKTKWPKGFTPPKSAK